MRFNTIGTIATAAALGVMVATGAQAGPPPCSEVTVYKEAVIDQFEQKVGDLPAELMSPDILGMAAQRFALQSHSLKTLKVGDEVAVTFKMNNSAPESFNCSGEVTDVPGLERSEQGQAGLVQSHREIVDQWIIAR